MGASDFGAGGSGEMGKLGWSVCGLVGRAGGVGCERVRGSRMREVWFRADLVLVAKTEI